MQQKLFPLCFIMSLTFSSFLGSLLPHFLAISTEERRWNPQRQWMCRATGEPAALLQLQETWTQACWKRLSSLKKEWQNNLPKSLGVLGQKLWGSMENRSALSTLQTATVLLQLQGDEDTSKARFAMQANITGWPSRLNTTPARP